MLSQANHHGETVWAVKQSTVAASTVACAHAKISCADAPQAPGSSPSSDTSCAMEYGVCSMPATPAAQEQGAGNGPVSFEGWFAKCRGCGCMTAHEKLIKDADVPFCRRCQQTLSTACPAMQQKMVDTLLYVHHAWSNAGL